MTTTSKQDLDYMSDPMKWVTMLCPLKRYKDNLPEFAYLVGDGPNLHHGNMFNAKESDPVTKLSSFEEILNAGWMVD